MQEDKVHIQIVSKDHPFNLNHFISICQGDNQGAEDVSFDLLIHSLIYSSAHPRNIAACHMPVGNNCTFGKGNHAFLEN